MTRRTRRRIALFLLGGVLGIIWNSVPPLLPAEAACPTRVVNASGVANAAIAVTNAAAVTVLPQVLSTATGEGRCAALIHNESGGGDVRCAQAGVTPTTGVAGKGILIPAGMSLQLGPFSEQLWACIATTATAATLSTVEERS